MPAGSPLSPGSKPADDFQSRGGKWVIGQSLLMIAVLVAGPWGQMGKAGDIQRVVGGFGVAVGAVLGVAGALHLGRNRTVYPRPRSDAVLVQHGVYGWVRHPLYSSMMFLSAGWALLWHSVWAGGCGLALALWLVAKARREEVWLRERFAEYESYARRVRAFVPGLW